MTKTVIALHNSAKAPVNYAHTSISIDRSLFVTIEHFITKEFEFFQPAIWKVFQTSVQNV